MKKYSHDNWNQVLVSPTEWGREADLRVIGKMSVNNLFWFVRRCISMDKDIALFEKYPDWQGQFIEPTQWTKRRRKIENEDLIS